MNNTPRRNLNVWRPTCPGLWILTFLTLQGCGQKPSADPPLVDNPPLVAEKAPVPISIAAFQEAAFNGQLDTVRQATEAGVEIDSVDADGRTALQLAAFNGHTEVVRWLLEKGAAVEHQDNEGRTALMYAATGPNQATVAALLEAGAAPNAVDHGEKFTALMHAAAEGQLEVVQTLLQHNADAQMRDVDGDTARDFAERNGHAEVARLLQP